MKSKLLIAALLASTTFGYVGTAFAQDAPPPAPDAAPAAEDDADVKVTQEAPQSNEDLAARAAFLEAQLEALQAQINELKGQMVKATPSWKGAPQWEDKDLGFTFKPRGRIQLDSAYIEDPGNNPLVGVQDQLNRNLGFNSRIRRIRLGAEGTVGGGFGYKFEMDYANGSVGFGDAIMTYAAKNGLTLTFGNHETFESLEQITSSRFISFLERAQMNDAFIHTRRLGASVAWQNKPNTLRFGAGLFTAHSIDASLDNDGWIAAGRLTYAPQLAGGTIHFGANAQYRDFQSNNCTNRATSCPVANSTVGSPSTNQLGRYRARPFLQTTDVRFVDTGAFAAKGDMILGLELAGIFKAFHFAGEAQWVKVNAYSPGDVKNRPLDGFDADNTVLVPTGDPKFFSWYAEAGYFLTGETRGYKNGMWDRTTPLKPFSKGGWGAFQVNARYDYLDLNTDKLFNAVNNNFDTGVFTANPNLSRGGKQQGIMASLIWIPEAYFRVLLQLAHTKVTGGPFAATVDPGSSDPVNERTYGVNSVASRIQIDF